ncbi:MAG: SGNH/GDSL hydrolase family protein [Candidatus Hydrogenedentes bacterium]|nr:SGNH/GDSL hydrolase family protein [Candidatus Hydrogenedentota bacterium]
MTIDGASRQDAPTDAIDAAPPLTDTKPASIQTRLRNGIVIAVTTLLLLEGILRVMGIANPLLYDADPNVGYRIKPNQEISYFRNSITINAYGVRDPRPLTTRDPGKKRVLCLGDSVTWGGIYERQENLFTSIAERRLGNLEVINAGVNGYSARQMAELYKNFLAELKPDLILVCALVRDFERPPRSKLTGSGVAFPTQKPLSAIVEAMRICQLTAYERWDLDWLEPSSAAEPDWTEHETYEQANTRSIMALAETIGNDCKLVVVFLPIESGERLRIRRNFGRNLQNNGVEVARLPAELNHDDYVDGVHLSTSGHRKVGEALAVIIDDELRQ